MIKVFNLKIAMEIAIVFAVMLTVKEIADNLAITGAGSIAMWSAIIVATIYDGPKVTKLAFASEATGCIRAGNNV